MTLCASCAAGVPCHEHDQPAGEHYDPPPRDVVTDVLDWSTDLLEALDGVMVRLWFCPDQAGHNPEGELRPTVEWRDGVAHCLEPDCGRTSAGRA